MYDPLLGQRRGRRWRAFAKFTRHFNGCQYVWVWEEKVDKEIETGEAHNVAWDQMIRRQIIKNEKAEDSFLPSFHERKRVHSRRDWTDRSHRKRNRSAKHESYCFGSTKYSDSLTKRGHVQQSTGHEPSPVSYLRCYLACSDSETGGTFRTSNSNNMKLKLKATLPIHRFNISKQAGQPTPPQTLPLPTSSHNKL